MASSADVSSARPDSAVPAKVRAGGWYLLLALAVIVVVMVPVQRALLRGADDVITAEIEAEVDDFRAAVDTAEQPVGRDLTLRLLRDFVAEREPRADTVVVALYDGNVVAASWSTLGDQLASAVPAPLTESQWGSMEAEVALYRWLAVPVGERGSLIVAADTTGEESTASDRVWAVALAAGAALVLGGLAARLIRRSRPVGHPGPSGPALSTDEVVGAGFHTTTTAPRSWWLRLVDVDDLSAHIFDRLRGRGDGRRWLGQGDATGDVVCDPDQIYQVLLTLADEVVRNTDSGAQLRFDAHSHDGGVVFSVSHRAVETPTRKLSAVLTESQRAVVDAHDGRVWIELTDDSTVRSLFVPRTQAVGPVFGP